MKVLPIGNPPAHGYLNFAYPLAIISQTDDYLPWLYSNFIDLQVYKSFPNGLLTFSSPYPTEDFHLSVPCLHTQKIHKSGIPDDRHGLVSYIQNAIDRGFYVQLYLDEFYISSRTFFNRFHNTHANLIYGYDPESEKFVTLGYNRNRQFTESLIPYSEIATAYEHYLQSDHDPLGRTRHFDFMYLFSFDAQAKEPYRFDQTLLKQAVQRYVAGGNPMEPFRALRNPVNECLYGVEVYGALLTYLYYLTPEEFINFIPFHVLWEHKELMNARIRYMLDNELLDNNSGLAAAFDEIAKSAMIVRSYVIRYNTRKSESILFELMKRLERLRIQEMFAMNKLLLYV